MNQTDSKKYNYKTGNERTKIKRFFNKLKRVIIPVSILVFGLVMIFLLIKFKPQAEKTIPKTLAPLVKVQEVNLRDVEMIVKQWGTVTPKVEVEIVPQVSGKIVWVNPKFKAGGFIRADEVILKVDKRDYELAVQQANSVVADAQVNLDIEKAEAEVAIREWR